jgi:hypothetical protein
LGADIADTRDPELPGVARQIFFGLGIEVRDYLQIGEEPVFF